MAELQEHARSSTASAPPKPEEVSEQTQSDLPIVDDSGSNIGAIRDSCLSEQATDEEQHLVLCEAPLLQAANADVTDGPVEPDASSWQDISQEQIYHGLVYTYQLVLQSSARVDVNVVSQVVTNSGGTTIHASVDIQLQVIRDISYVQPPPFDVNGVDAAAWDGNDTAASCGVECISLNVQKGIGLVNDDMDDMTRHGMPTTSAACSCGKDDTTKDDLRTAQDSLYSLKGDDRTVSGGSSSMQTFSANDQVSPPQYPLLRFTQEEMEPMDVQSGDFSDENVTEAAMASGSRGQDPPWPGYVPE